MLFVVWLVVCCHIGNCSHVTLAFEDAQVIEPFSRETTNNIDDTDDTEECRNEGMQECKNVEMQKFWNVRM